jgi:hypothetical protein
LIQNKQNTVGAGGAQNQEQASAFFFAVERVMRPICRMLVRRGFTIHNVTELVKRAFLAGAADVLTEQGHPVTESRLSIWTSLPLREVRRVRSAVASSVDLTETKFAKIGRLVTAWHLDPRYTIQFTGTPHALPIDAVPNDHNNTPSFEELVREFAPGFDHRQLLEELCRVKTVSIAEETQLVHILTRVYLPEPYDRTDSERLGRMLSNYATTMDVNSRKARQGGGYFDRHVSADFAISPEDEAEFHMLVRAVGQDALEKLDDWLNARLRVEENGRRAGLAMFYHVESDVQPGTSSRHSSGPSQQESDGLVPFTDNASDDDKSNIIDTLTFKFRGKE